MKNQIRPRTLKGFRDFGGIQARKRQYVIDRLKTVFESYGFEPLETPALEYEEILLGKYGDEGDKLMYRFEDNGKRSVAMRYDQTVPLARFVAQNDQTITYPFKRYQIQPVWRAENTQKGRYREFLQCDIDTVGTSSSLADAEIIALVVKAYESLGFENFKVFINDRSNFEGLTNQVITQIDKINKITDDTKRKKLIDDFIGKADKKTAELLASLINKQRSETITEVEKKLKDLGIPLPKTRYEYMPMLARGLDYYTSTILEVEVKGYTAGSVGGGGRYDNLIGMFVGKQIPAVGFAFGFDRIYEAMEEQKLFPEELNESETEILITVFPGFEGQSMKLTSTLRNEGVNTELYLEDAKLDKQLKYADRKEIPYAVVLGPEEAKSKTVTLKNMNSMKQETIPQEELIRRFSCKCDCGDCNNDCNC